MKTLNWKGLLTDVVGLGIFSLLARIAHQKDGLELSFTGVLDTAWPFWFGAVIGWLLAELRKQDGTQVRSGGWYIWIITVVLGLAIWGIRHAEFPHWSFILVASSTSAIILLGWRALFGKKLSQK